MLVGTPAAEGKLDGVGLAEYDHARRDHAAGDGRCHDRAAIAPVGRAAGGDLPLKFDQILERDRDTMQRSDRMVRSNGLVRALRRETRAWTVDVHESVQLGLQSLDARKER